jgi:hypothetical protein
MSEGEIRTFLPRHESDESGDRVVVGQGGSILANALMRAAACLPPNLQGYEQPCGPQANACEQLGVTRQTQNVDAATAAGTSTLLTYEFERPFKLAMITVKASLADDFTLTSLKAAGDEMIKNGEINMGPFSSANLDGGGAYDAPWVMPGQKLKLTVRNATLVGAADVPFTVTGASR